MGPLGFVKDANLRTRAAVEPEIVQAAAPHRAGRRKRAVIRELKLEPCSACNLRCRDLNGRGAMGNTHQSSLHELFRGEKRRAAIQATRENRRRDLRLCGMCEME
jgi:hypothetical protein